MNKCSICKKMFPDYETYEYRGALACEKHFDEAIKMRDFQRGELMAEENSKLDKLNGLDIGDNPIGKANREMLKTQIEIASKESGRMKSYEGRI